MVAGVYKAIEEAENKYWEDQERALLERKYAPKIKLCGLSRAEDIACANELVPDYVGFVFAPQSKRYVSPEQALELKALLSPEIKAVGVFVDADVSEIVSIVQSGAIDVVQLHGHESEEYIGHLRFALADGAGERYKSQPQLVMPLCPMIFKAFSVKSLADVDDANISCADYVLLDAGSGGTGTAFNWDLARAMKRPYLLAGGLDCNNVREALETLHPFGVDVSSGIESNGLKDLDKMRAFVTGVRSAS